MLGRVAVFHDKVQERKIVKDDIMFKAYYGAYWLVKEEISNRKFPIGNFNLYWICLNSLALMKWSISNIFLRVLWEKSFWHWALHYLISCWKGWRKHTVIAYLLKKLLMFLSWKCLLPSSSTLTKDTGKVETSFLFIEDVLKNSNSANAETIFTVLTAQLMEFGLEL